jgi:hypothetical protein
LELAKSRYGYSDRELCGVSSARPSRHLQSLRHPCGEKMDTT